MSPADFLWRVTATATLPGTAPDELSDEVHRAFVADGGLPDVEVDRTTLTLRVTAPGGSAGDAAERVGVALAAVLADRGLDVPRDAIDTRVRI